MRIYYRGRDAVVTSELFVRCDPPAGSFAIRDLRNVEIASAEPGGFLAAAVPIAVAALAAGGLAVRMGGPWFGLAVLAVAGVITICAAVRRQHRPRLLVLRADYRGRRADLFSSTDERVFNQVKRALLRAIEDRLLSSWDEARAA